MGGHLVTSRPLDGLTQRDSWDGIRATVAGFGVSGFAAADNLTHLGASVTALDEAGGGAKDEQAELLGVLGADVRLGPGSTDSLPDDCDLLVVSPGWRPDASLIAQASARGVPVWGEVELAWRLRDPDRPAPWLAITGTNGKTTTVQMLDSILRAAGLRSAAIGNVGRPVVEAVMDPEPYDVFAVELSSFQLHYTSSMRAESAVVLNLAEDHLDWYSGADPMGAYAADKGRIYRGVQRACVYNVADPLTDFTVRQNVVQPYLGAGYSRRIGDRVSLTLDFGALYAGTPDLDVTSRADTLGFSKKQVRDQIERARSRIAPFTLYPVVQAGFTFRF